jgi:hypothetical protein
VVNYVDPAGLKVVFEKKIEDGNGKLCGTFYVYEPSLDGKHGIEFKFDESNADKDSNCCKPCVKEKATYGIIQHQRGHSDDRWRYDNMAGLWTGGSDSYGGISNPDSPTQPTRRPAFGDARESPEYRVLTLPIREIAGPATRGILTRILAILLRAWMSSIRLGVALRSRHN